MPRIYKYPLQIVDQQTIKMPAGAVPLSVQFQGDDLVLWAKVDPDGPESARCFRIIGTGNPFEGNPGIFLGTAQEPRRPLVWHVFWS